MVVRQRRTNVVETIKSLDAFPKMSDTYMKTTRSGGTISLLTFAVMIVLLYNEYRYYIASIRFRFEPDTDMDALLPLHVDVVVATPCHTLSSDVSDSTHAIISGVESMEQINTWWELSEEQEEIFRRAQLSNAYLRENYHGLKEQMLQSRSYHKLPAAFPERIDRPSREPDACRVRGSLVLHKVAGNFHVRAMQMLTIPGFGVQLYIVGGGMSPSNFSHRILRFQFGDWNYGLVNPMEGNEVITTEENMMAQYFVEVVPTDVRGLLGTKRTYQYSMKQQMRAVDHNNGSHGVAGLFVRYEMAALKVVISENREPLLQFLLRLCCVCGGIYVCAGLLNSMIGWLLCYGRVDSSQSTDHSPVSCASLTSCAATIPSARGKSQLKIVQPTP